MFSDKNICLNICVLLRFQIDPRRIGISVTFLSIIAIKNDSLVSFREQSLFFGYRNIFR